MRTALDSVRLADGDGGAFGGEEAGDGSPDPPASTGDDGSFSFEWDIRETLAVGRVPWQLEMVPPDPMDCPYCRHPLVETSAACPSCGFQAAALERWLGPAPHLSGGLNDLMGVLDKKQSARIEAARHHFVQRFPQCDFHFVLGGFDPQVPLAVMAFAFFNFSRLSAPNRNGGANRDLLLLTDSAAETSHLAVGYGLEPLVPREGWPL